MSTRVLLGSLLLGVAIRCVVFYIFDTNPDLHSFISHRVEISTPISSWRAFKEGMYLKQHGFSPYENNIFHSTPILLKLPEIADFENNSILLQCILILLDVVTAVNLYYIACSSQSYFLSSPYLQKYKNSENEIKNKLLLSPYFAIVCTLFYYLNPFVILTTCCKSNSHLSHALISTSMALSIYGLVTLSSFVLGIATIFDVYPCLLLPILILIALKSHQNVQQNKSLSIALYVITFCITVAYLFGFNFICNSSKWDFVKQCYLFMFEGDDITPNISGWWYLKMSLFRRFQKFFTIILNAQTLVFVFPFIWRFGSYPYFCAYLVIHLFEVFRVYPCLSDTIFGFSFLFISSFITYNHFRCV